MILNKVWKNLCNYFKKPDDVDHERERRTTPVGLFHYAHSYALSATKLREETTIDATHPDAPVSFLYKHAIELYLKSFLRLNGVSVKQLRSQKYGHNTKKLVNKARRFGLAVTDEQKSQILMVQDAILDRYIETGVHTAPTLDALHALCVYLNNEIGPQVYIEAGFAHPFRLLGDSLAG